MRRLCRKRHADSLDLSLPLGQSSSIAVSSAGGHWLLKAGTGGKLHEALVHVQRVRLHESFLELPIEVLSRQVLHDVEDQLNGVLVEVGKGVAILLESVLLTSDGGDPLCLGKPAHRLAGLERCLLQVSSVMAANRDLLGPPSHLLLVVPLLAIHFNRKCTEL